MNAETIAYFLQLIGVTFSLKKGVQLSGVIILFIPL